MAKNTKTSSIFWTEKNWSLLQSESVGQLKHEKVIAASTLALLDF